MKRRLTRKGRISDYSFNVSMFLLEVIACYFHARAVPCNRKIGLVLSLQFFASETRGLFASATMAIACERQTDRDASQNDEKDSDENRRNDRVKKGKRLENSLTRRYPGYSRTNLFRAILPYFLSHDREIRVEPETVQIQVIFQHIVSGSIFNSYNKNYKNIFG